MRALPWAALAFLSACGGDVRFRPLALDVQGLSGRAERLTVLIFPESTGQSCFGVDLTNVQSLDAPFSAVWNRSTDGNERRFELPTIEERSVTIIAYSEDAQGMPIQFGCTQIDYADLESPEASLRLSMRVAVRVDMVSGCRSSGPSSSSACSAAVGWRRPSSAFAETIRSITRSC